MGRLCRSILESKEINGSKRAGLWQSMSGIPLGKLNISVRSFEKEKL